MLLYNIESIAKKLQIEYADVTKHIAHKGVMGNSRENVLQKYLGQLLPHKFTVGNGIITDCEGTQSRQQDFFIYDAFNSPVFYDMDTSCVIPIESVYATVEVKSTLTKSALEESIKNIQSVKALKKNPLINSIWIPNNHNLIYGTIFAYSSDTSLDTIAKNLHSYCLEMEKSLQPSVVCVLDKGLLVNVLKDEPNHIYPMPTEKTMWAMIKNEPEKNLYLYYLLLLQQLNTATNFPPDLMKYAKLSNTLTPMEIVIPKEMIPYDMHFSFGNAKLSGADFKQLTESFPLLYKALSNKLTEEDIKAAGLTHEQAIELLNKSTDILINIIKDNSKETT